MRVLTTDIKNAGPYIGVEAERADKAVHAPVGEWLAEIRMYPLLWALQDVLAEVSL